MSTPPKGYPSQEKDDRLLAQYATVSPSGEKVYGLDVIDRATVFEAATDVVEASSTTSRINATGHAARIGDRIRFTSGANDGREAVVVPSDIDLPTTTDTNTIDIAPTLDTAPSTSDTFSIMRPVSPRSDSSGASITTPGSIQFDLDTGSGPVATKVIKDTVTPANNIPLPVELVSVTGVINITANDLNVQLSHLGVNADSTRIGDGTNLMAVNVSLEAQVRDDDAVTELATISGAVAGSEMQVDIVSAGPLMLDVTGVAIGSDTTSIDAKTPALGAALIAASRPVNIASNQVVPISATTLPLPTGASTSGLQTAGNTDLATIAGAVSGTEMQVDIVASLPPGANNIGGVDVLSSALPTGAATSSLQTSGNTDLSTIAGAVSGSEMQVDVITSALPTGAATSANQSTGNSTLSTIETNTNPLDVDDTVFVDFSSSNLPGNATNPLELVSSLSTNIKKIQVADTGGAPMELMTGSAASEVRKLLIGPGSDQSIEVDLPSTTRVSIRRVDDAAALAVGNFSINFLGDA